jgi:hypothetical protein
MSLLDQFRHNPQRQGDEFGAGSATPDSNKRGHLNETTLFLRNLLVPFRLPPIVRMASCIAYPLSFPSYCLFIAVHEGRFFYCPRQM